MSDAMARIEIKQSVWIDDHAHVVDASQALTVAQLREVLKDWPDTHDDGTPTYVWIETGKNLTSMVTAHFALNRRYGVADFMLASSAFDDDAGA